MRMSILKGLLRYTIDKGEILEDGKKVTILPMSLLDNEGNKLLMQGRHTRWKISNASVELFKRVNIQPPSIPISREGIGKALILYASDQMTAKECDTIIYRIVNLELDNYYKQSEDKVLYSI